MGGIEQTTNHKPEQQIKARSKKKWHVVGGDGSCFASISIDPWATHPRPLIAYRDSEKPRLQPLPDVTPALNGDDGDAPFFLLLAVGRRPRSENFPTALIPRATGPPESILSRACGGASSWIGPPLGLRRMGQTLIIDRAPCRHPTANAHDDTRAADADRSVNPDRGRPTTKNENKERVGPNKPAQREGPGQATAFFWATHHTHHPRTTDHLTSTLCISTRPHTAFPAGSRGQAGGRQQGGSK